MYKPKGEYIGVVNTHIELEESIVYFLREFFQVCRYSLPQHHILKSGSFARSEIFDHFFNFAEGYREHTS